MKIDFSELSYEVRLAILEIVNNDDPNNWETEFKAMHETFADQLPDDIPCEVFSNVLAQVMQQVKESEHSYEEAMENIVVELRKDDLPKQPPYRVRVFSGDQSVDLGEGVYEGDVDVYFMIMSDGSLQSNSNAEVEPIYVPAGARVIKKLNPKIRLDNGRIVYGCQVWFSPVEDNNDGCCGGGCGCHED